MEQTLKQKLVSELAIKASEGRLALFVGAGFSKAVMGKYTSGPLKGEDRALSWIDLLWKVARHFGIEDVVPWKDCKKPLDCPQIASELIKRLHEKNPDKDVETCNVMIKNYVCQLTDWYPDKVQKKEWPKIFAAIRPAVIVTTNYDHVLESLLEERAVSYSSTDTLPTSLDEDYLIYHVHGVRNRPDDIVLTREDYIEALRPFSYRQVRLTTLLRENSVLYLGYGKNDLNVVSAIDIAQQTFPDVSGRRASSIHVQIERDVNCDTAVVELPSSNKAIRSYVIKAHDIKEFLLELAKECKNNADEVSHEYERNFSSLQSLLKEVDYQGINKRFSQRRANIYNAFENTVKLLNTPTLLGRKIARKFDDYIKGYYRALDANARKPGNWEGYADMWSLLFSYFSMFSPQYAPREGDVFNAPTPYTRRFVYAIEWFNALAYWIGDAKGKSKLAWSCFKEDWPKLPLEVKEMIVQSANRRGYKQIDDLLKRAGFENQVPKEGSPLIDKNDGTLT